MQRGDGTTNRRSEGGLSGASLNPVLCDGDVSCEPSGLCHGDDFFEVACPVQPGEHQPLELRQINPAVVL